MFNAAKYQPYEAVRNEDSSDEHEHEHDNHTRDDAIVSSTKITDLLKLTAHRRIRAQNNTVSIAVNDDDDAPLPPTSTAPVTEPGVSPDLHDVDLEDTHRESGHDDADADACTADESEGECYDDFAWLLHLDGKKRKIGVLHTWTIFDLKRKYFAVELKNGSKIRLIHRGKLLQDGMQWSSYAIGSDAFIHVSITKNAATASKTDGAVGMHDRNYAEFDDGMDDETVARRLQMELNRDDHDRFAYPARSAINSGGGGAGPGGMEREADLTRARREFFCGVLLGSIMGFWSLIFLLMAYRNQYSRRFRLGVSVGVAINFMLGLMYQVPSNAHNASDSDGTSEDAGTDHLSDGQQVGGETETETAGAT